TTAPASPTRSCPTRSTWSPPATPCPTGRLATGPASSTTARPSWSGATRGGEPSVRELERLTGELGLFGALVNPSDGAQYLDAPAAEPFLAAAAALGTPLFLHPSRDLPAPEDSREFALNVSLARPHQTATCIARLIYSGSFDRHPGLKLLLAHGGGTLPYIAGRLDGT